MIPQIILYTDGGCRGNPGHGGWGCLLIHIKTGQAMSQRGGNKNTTNNRMEMVAAIEGIKALKPGLRIEIRSDSKYLIDTCTKWRHGWRKRGWRKSSGDIVSNVDLVKQLDELCDSRTVVWTWVKGHSGNAGNEFADRLTNLAMNDVEDGGSGNAKKMYKTSPVRV